MKSKIEGLKPQGGGVYEDNKGRLYIGDKKKQILYAVDRDSQKKLSFYQQRYTLPLVVLVLVGFYLNWYAAVPLALVVLIVFEYLYRKRFLADLPVYENIDIPESSSLKQRLEQTKNRKLWTITILSALLAVLLIVNLNQTVSDWSQAFHDPNVAILIIVTIALDVYAIYFLINAINVLVQKIKQDK